MVQFSVLLAQCVMVLVIWAMDIKAQYFACFSKKLAPARKISTDWSARSARFCNSATYETGEPRQNFESGRRVSFLKSAYLPAGCGACAFIKLLPKMASMFKFMPFTVNPDLRGYTFMIAKHVNDTTQMWTIWWQESFWHLKASFLCELADSQASP